MSETQDAPIGAVVWRDLTVDNAEEVRDFYCDVVGWQFEPVAMGAYSDFNMMPASGGEGVAGICHARGQNAKLPPQWLIYLTVADVDKSAARCLELGGKVIDGPRAMGRQRVCVIQDPAGAVAALVGDQP